ncbi:Galactose-binding domain-like [Phytophthora cactorum]|nr:Galactose-binding domain-like [Phytophthora cactorum]
MSWYATSFPYPTQQVMASGSQSSILLDFLGLTRGRAYINGHDLGRYWLINDEGDFVQRYYHVPRDWLVKDRENLLIVFDDLAGRSPMCGSCPPQWSQTQQQWQ